MLLSAGMSISDPLLSTFFQVTCIDDAAFSFLEHAVQPSTTSRPSYELLIKIVARTAKFASWADASSCAQEHLMMVAFDDKCELSTCDFAMRWDDLILRVKLPCPGADASSGQSCFCFCLIIMVLILLMAANDMHVMHCNCALVLRWSHACITHDGCCMGKYVQQQAPPSSFDKACALCHLSWFSVVAEW